MSPHLQTPSAPARNDAAILRIDPRDDVAVALRGIAAGETLAVGGVEIRAADDIPAAHKIALRPIDAGAPVRKYGWPIGRARCAIAAGAHVHAHNLETLLSDGASGAGADATTLAPGLAPTGAAFEGYVRADGRVGVRNELWVIATVGCVARTCQRIAARGAAAFVRPGDGIDGVHAITHPLGCSQLGDDAADTRAILAGLATHPNAGGVLIVGLGCESNQLDALVASIDSSSRERLRTFACQAVEDEDEAGFAALEALAALARADRRTRVPASRLAIGVKCGGSDGLSGVTANPLVGRITDRVTDEGGTAILTELPEIFGAEHILAARAVDEDVREATLGLVRRFKRYYLDHGHPVSENPSPGNIAGGITTLEEKSLGAVQKAGRAQLTDVLAYGARARRPGLTLLAAPGNDAVSTTALAAAGATIVLFTTGRGTPLGCMAPTLKIASNTEMARRKPRWIDVDAGGLVRGEDAETAAAALFELVLDTASGRPTCNERNDEREVAIWKTGVTL